MQPSTPFQQAPFLREQRNFPRDDMKELSRQTDQSYVDIAQKMNARTIGVYATNFPLINGETWYLTGDNKKQQAMRQVYPLGAIGTNSPISIATGLKKGSYSMITRLWGMAVTSVDYRPLPYVSSSAVTGQTDMRFDVASGNIVGFNGSTATPIVSGFIVLEWLSNVTTNS